MEKKEKENRSERDEVATFIVSMRRMGLRGASIFFYFNEVLATIFSFFFFHEKLFTNSWSLKDLHPFLPYPSLSLSGSLNSTTFFQEK